MRGGGLVLRTKGIIVSHFTYGKASTRQLDGTLIALSGSGHTRNLIDSLKLSSICKSASQAVLCRMQRTFHATRRTPHGASCLVRAMSTWSMKPGILRPGVVGMRGSMVIRLRPCMNIEYPPPPFPIVAFVFISPFSNIENILIISPPPRTPPPKTKGAGAFARRLQRPRGDKRRSPFCGKHD